MSAFGNTRAHVKAWKTMAAVITGENERRRLTQNTPVQYLILGRGVDNAGAVCVCVLAGKLRER